MCLHTAADLTHQSSSRGSKKTTTTARLSPLAAMWARAPSLTALRKRQSQRALQSFMCLTLKKIMLKTTFGPALKPAPTTKNICSAHHTHAPALQKDLHKSQSKRAQTQFATAARARATTRLGLSLP